MKALKFYHEAYIVCIMKLDLYFEEKAKSMLNVLLSSKCLCVCVCVCTCMCHSLNLPCHEECIFFYCILRGTTMMILMSNLFYVLCILGY
jgi:hypothetical protein